MLVGNKSDLASSRKTSLEMGQNFAQEEGLLFAEASAKSGEGVEELFMEIGMFFVPAHCLLDSECSLVPHPKPINLSNVSFSFRLIFAKIKGYFDIMEREIEGSKIDIVELVY